jgi:hypothetical protein
VRSIDAEELSVFLSLQGIVWVSVQYGRPDTDVAEASQRAGVRLEQWPDAVDDLDELAALLCALDHVVSVCNATVHLSGALGCNTSVLVPATPEWRYQTSGDAMLWYPSVRLFRQQRLGDWRGPLEGVRQELSGAVA